MRRKCHCNLCNHTSSNLEKFWRKTNQVFIWISIFVILFSFIWVVAVKAEVTEPAAVQYMYQESESDTPREILSIMNRFNCKDVRILKAIMTESDRLNLDGAIIAAVIAAESEFNRKAISHMNCRGLMQLSADKLDDWQNIEKNVAVGCRYLKDQINTFGSLHLGLAAYNAGPGNVQKYKGVPPFEETQNYVKKILNIIKNAKKSSENNPLPNKGSNKYQNFKGGISHGKNTDELYQQERFQKLWQSSQRSRLTPTDNLPNGFANLTTNRKYLQKNC
jgi:hypothetical protein